MACDFDTPVGIPKFITWLGELPVIDTVGDAPTGSKVIVAC